MTVPIDEITTAFSDIEPIYNHDEGDGDGDGHVEVCTINYPSSFKLAYGYIRAIWERKEYSERALRLSGTCVKLNPANYTAWHFRRECLKRLVLQTPTAAEDEGGQHQSLPSSNENKCSNSTTVHDAVERELDLAAALGGSNPKNYQIWYHRRAMLENCGVHDFADSELDYIATVLEEDSKNYHAWSYRQWIVHAVDTSAAWETEVQYASELIKQDARNNSAWNQRWFAAHRGMTGPLSADLARTEADFAFENGTKVDPYNESPMRYLVAILNEQSSRNQQQNIDDDTSGQQEMTTVVADYEKKIASLRTVLEDAGRNPDECFNLTAAHIDVLEMIGDVGCLQKVKYYFAKSAFPYLYVSHGCFPPSIFDFLCLLYVFDDILKIAQALKLVEDLATKYDVIRRKYWKVRQIDIQSRIGRLQ